MSGRSNQGIISSLEDEIANLAVRLAIMEDDAANRPTPKQPMPHQVKIELDRVYEVMDELRNLVRDQNKTIETLRGQIEECWTGGAD